MLPERISARSHRRLTAVRAARLIDALIDQAHRDWPDAGFVIRLPSGEDVFLPAHRSGGTPCPLGHAGYFRDRVRPFCEVDPTLHAGICRITPLALDQDPPTAHAYQREREKPWEAAQPGRGRRASGSVLSYQACTAWGLGPG